MIPIPEVQGKLVPERFEIWYHYTRKYYIIDKETGKMYEADSIEAVKLFLEKFRKKVVKEIAKRIPKIPKKYLEVKAPVILSPKGKPLMPPNFQVEGVKAEWLPIHPDKVLWIPVPDDLLDKVWINPETGDYYKIVEEKGQKFFEWMDIPPEAIKLMLERGPERNVYVNQQYRAELIERGFSYLTYRDPRTKRAWVVRIPISILRRLK